MSAAAASTLADAIAVAVRAAALDAIEQGRGVEAAVQKATAAEITRYGIEVVAERPTERRRRENAELLAQLDALGDSRNAAMIVARRVVGNGDPAAAEILAQHLRRLRRARKTSSARLASK
jgi:hypothetical protein